MIRVTLHTEIEAPINLCFDLARDIDFHIESSRETGEQAVGGITTGLIGLGESVRWRAKHFGVRQYLTSQITALDAPTYFQDTMTEGAFRSFQHDHHFLALTPSRTRMSDQLTFAAPIPVFGIIAERLLLQPYMTKFLQHRNLALKRRAEQLYRR